MEGFDKIDWIKLTIGDKMFSIKEQRKHLRKQIKKETALIAKYKNRSKEQYYGAMETQFVSQGDCGCERYDKKVIEHKKKRSNYRARDKQLREDYRYCAELLKRLEQEVIHDEG